MEYVIIIILVIGINVLVTVFYTRRQIKLHDIRKARLDRLDNLRKYLAAFLLRSNDINGKEDVKQNLCAILVNLDIKDDNSNELYKLIKDYLDFLKDHDSDENKVEEIIKQGNKALNSEPVS